MYDLCLVGCFLTAIDIERVMKEAPWTFNNHHLVFHRLGNMEDPLLVPLFYSYFCVQVHDLPSGGTRVDISLRAPSIRRAAIAKNVWLRGESVVCSVGDSLESDGGRVAKGFLGSDGISNISRVLGLNLVGKSKKGCGRVIGGYTLTKIELSSHGKLLLKL
ncbi:hypothetical protein Golax_010372 [Gossypium laxum]|uniref:DUF4283 domain-containing protein n=1 Tax=Gossypium laxum TaxID=34288 RepID=A0A7J8ZH21_9ROSI|nr:hypothetical protein [Gossypium laxum]